MAALGDLFGSIDFGGGKGSGGFMGSIMTIIFAVMMLLICVGVVWFFLYRRKNWNIKVEFKIPRNVRKVRMKDGTVKVIGTLNKEWGKGFYNAKRGVVMVKRKGKKPVPMKPFDIKSKLSSGNILTVMQVGIEDYRPVWDDSYIMVRDEKTNETGALVNAKIDTSEGKSWKNSYERERKNVYSIMSWMKEHGQLIGLGFVIFLILAGFGVLWTRLPKICG